MSSSNVDKELKKKVFQKCGEIAKEDGRKDDFAIGIVSNLNSNEDALRLLEYIDAHGWSDTDDIIQLTLQMDHEVNPYVDLYDVEGNPDELLLPGILPASRERVPYVREEIKAVLDEHPNLSDEYKCKVLKSYDAICKSSF